MTDDDARFNMLASHVRCVAEAFLTEQWGERCPDFEPDCECCKRWFALDVLLQAPRGPVTNSPFQGGWQA